MAIPEEYRSSFDALLEAAEEGAVALVECKVRSTGGTAYVIAMVFRDENDNYDLVPMARMVDKDSPEFDDLIPPQGDDVGIDTGQDYP